MARTRPAVADTHVEVGPLQQSEEICQGALRVSPNRRSSSCTYLVRASYLPRPV